MRAPALRTLALAFLTTGMLSQDAVGQVFRSSPRGSRSFGSSTSQDSLNQQAEAAYKSQDYDRCIELTNQVLARDPRSHVALYLRGSAKVESGQRERDVKRVREGIADAREAISIKRNDNSIYYLPYLFGMAKLAEMENRKEHAEVAETVATQVLEKNQASQSEQAHLYYQRASARMRLGKLEDALSDYNAALQRDSKHLGALLDLANAYASAGRDSEALGAYNRAITAAPNNPNVLHSRGTFLLGAGELQPAVDDFTKALQTDPKWFYALNDRGFARMHLGNPVEAERDYTESLKIDPDQTVVYALRGTARLAQGNLNGAMEDQTAALKRSPNDPALRASLGFTRYFSKDYEGALREFDEVVALDPNARFLDAWRYSALQLTGRGTEAEQQFAAALEKPSENRDWWESLVAFVAGKIDADALLAEVGPASDELHSAHLCEAHYFIGHKFAEQGATTEAAQHFNAAVATEEYDLSAFYGAKLAVAGTKQASGPRLPTAKTSVP